MTSTTALKELKRWDYRQYEHFELPDPLTKNVLTVTGSFAVLLTGVSNALSLAVTSLSVTSIMASRVHSSSLT